MKKVDKDAIMDFLRGNDWIKSFLREHSRREALPRKACSKCQFEYNEEEKHECRVV